MSKTHWKKLAPSNYLGSWDLEEKLVVKIDKVQIEQLKPSPQAPEEDCVVVYVKGNKPFIANKTNLKAIEKALKTAYIEDWSGKEITLFKKQIRAFGETMDALRVEPIAPKPKAKPKLTDERFEKAIEAIKSGKAKKSDLDKYELSKEQQKTIEQC